MKQPTPIEWLQEVYKVTGKLKESDFDYANNWTKENTSLKQPTMTSERIKEIQQQTAYPDSISVQQALLQVWNECSQLPQQEISDEEIEEEIRNRYM